MIQLRNITKQNWRECIQLSLLPEQQGYLSSNVTTIAESKFEDHYQLRAIYKQEQMIGLIVYCHEDDPEDLEVYWIFRFMIDKNFQGQGFGKQAMKLTIEEIKKLGAKRILTMHKPTNQRASVLYQHLGFTPIGNVDDGDILLELQHSS